MDIADILDRLHRMEAAQNRYILERQDVTRGITICLINREHILLSGPPGIAKTTQVRLATKHIRNGHFFYTQLTPFSTLEDVFGPVDIRAYKEGERRRVGTHMLQSAHMAVIDEIYNGNESVLKALMAPMNEGIFSEEGQFKPIPLRALMGTTNQIPATDELIEKGLAAFHDRWLFRFEVTDLKSDANFRTMLRSPDIDFQAYLPAGDAVLSVEELDLLREESQQVRVPVKIEDPLVELRNMLKQENIQCSPRRWKQIRRALQTSAMIAGRQDVDTVDLGLLRHMLWSHPRDMAKVDRMLDEFLTSPHDRITTTYGKVVEVCGEFNAKRRSSRNTADISKMAMESRVKLQQVIGDMKGLRSEAKTAEDRALLDDYLQKSYNHLKSIEDAIGM